MSWSQGVQVREDLPAVFVQWADEKGHAPLECIVWFTSDPKVFWMDYGKAGSIRVRVEP